MAKAPKPPKPFKPYGRFRIALASTDSVKPSDFDKLPYPLLGSLKKDGIRVSVSPLHPDDIEHGLVHSETGWRIDRAYLRDGSPVFPVTRSLKSIPNRHTAALMATLPAGVDGEIGIVDENGVLHFRGTTSAIMSEDGEPDIRLFLFDHFLAPGGKLERYQALCALKPYLPSWVQVIEQRLINNADEARAFWAEAMDLDEEGLIFCILNAPYKPHRSTLKEGYMIKAKEKKRIEIRITRVEEEEENTNEQVRDERGFAKRSTHKAGKVGKGVMGTLIGVNEEEFPGQEIRVGSGFDAKTKKAFWEAPPIGELATIEFVVKGGYDAPRNAVFIDIRHPDDLS